MSYLENDCKRFQIARGLRQFFCDQVTYGDIEDDSIYAHYRNRPYLKGKKMGNFEGELTEHPSYDNEFYFYYNDNEKIYPKLLREYKKRQIHSR